MTRPKQFLVTALGISACAGVLLYLIKLHGQPAAVSPQRPAFSAASTAFPGNATPEETLRSLGWAAGKGDLELIRDNVTPEIRMMLHEGHGPHMAAHAIGVATALGAARILTTEVLSDGQVMLHVQAGGQENPWTVRMQKIDGSWKLAGLDL